MTRTHGKPNNSPPSTKEIETKKKHMKTITNIINPALTAIVLACFALSPVAQARPQPTRTPIDHKIARLRNEIIALDASLITHMSQAETSIGNDVELLHASIVAAQLETVDTAAAYLEAKSLIADLDTLRQHAIADLTMPSGYTPPNVPSTVLAGASTTDPETVLASTYQTSAIILSDLAAFTHDVLRLEASASAVLGVNNVELIMGNGGNDSISIADMFSMQMSMNQLSQLSEMSTAVVSAANTSIESMARNVKQ
jgi:hypothetical protein